MNQRTAGIALSYATLGVQVVVMLAYTPFVLRILGQEEFGLYQLVQSVIASLGMLSLGFSGAYVRFFTRFSVAGDREGMASLNGMFMTVFLCHPVTLVNFFNICLLLFITSYQQFTFQSFTILLIFIFHHDKHNQIHHNHSTGD